MRRLNEWQVRTTFLSVTLSAILPSAVALTLLATLGCETGESTARAPERPTPIERQIDPEPDAPDTGSELASIAERDVQAFLDRQNRRESGRDREDDRDPARPRGSDREILWNLPEESETAASKPIDLKDSDARSSELFLLSEDLEGRPAKPRKDSSGTEADLDIETDRIRKLIIELSKHLYREASYSDMPLRELMLIAASTMVTPDRALQPDAIPALTERERDLLRQFQGFFTHIGQELDGSRTADDVLLHALDELRASLSTKPQLHLETMALCTRVGGFGDYDPFNRYSFLAHSEQQAVLYLEIAGFTSELNQQSQWVTELSLQLMIYSDRDGIPVWREDWQTAVDVSRNKRQDFFMVQILTLPKALSVGRYHLKIRVRDEKSGAEAEGSIPFEMVADPKLAVGAGR